MAFPTTLDTITDGTTVITAAHVKSLQNILVGSVWVNVKGAPYNAVGDGVADDTGAIQAAITAVSTGGSGPYAGGVVFLPPGGYKLTAPLTITGNGVSLVGSSQFNTGLMIPTSGWAGAAMVDVNGATNVSIRDLHFYGQSSTYSSNGAADAIDLRNGTDGTTLDGVSFFYINGWCLNITPKADGTTSFATYVQNIHARLCKQGFYMKGGSTSFYSVGFNASNVILDTMQGGEGLLIDDATDCVFSSFQAQCNPGAGNPIHIRGRSTAIYFNAADSGGASGFTQPGVLIETFGGNSPKYIKFVGGTLSLATPGISITGGTHIAFEGVDISNNNGGGVIVSGGDLVQILGCSFNLNNTAVSATTYDISVTSGTPRVLIVDNQFDSASVTKAINHAANVRAFNNRFTAAAGNLGLNQLFATSGAPGANPTLGIDGDDANPFITLAPKGTGGVYVAPVGIGDYLQISPQTGLVELLGQGGSANMDVKLTPKGAGNVVVGAGNLRRLRQTPTETVLVSGVDATLGSLVGVTLTAARVVGAPLNPATGQRLSFTLIQSGAGAFAVTWNAAFKGITGGTSGATGTRATFSFVYDGTNWTLDGAQPTWVA